jgi:YHS domain-containing protein
MSYKLIALGLGVAVFFAWALVGCGATAAPPDGPAPPEKTAAEADKGGQPAAAPAPLTDEDRKLIEKQKVCPVSGEKLGSMGTPYKVTIKGRVVFLCCQGCEEELRKDPDKYLSKLPK